MWKPKGKRIWCFNLEILRLDLKQDGEEIDTHKSNSWVKLMGGAVKAFPAFIVFFATNFKMWPTTTISLVKKTWCPSCNFLCPRIWPTRSKSYTTQPFCGPYLFIFLPNPICDSTPISVISIHSLCKSIEKLYPNQDLPFLSQFGAHLFLKDVVDWPICDQPIAQHTSQTFVS